MFEWEKDLFCFVRLIWFVYWWIWGVWLVMVRCGGGVYVGCEGGV